MRTNYALGTFLEHAPFGGVVKGKALCTDGVVRSVRFPRGGHADTYSAIPATVTAYGKAVSGFVSTSALSGSDVADEDDPAVVRFTAFTYGKNAKVIPPAPVNEIRFEIVEGTSPMDGRPVYRVVEWRGNTCLGAHGSFLSVEAAYGYIAEREGVITRSWQHAGEGDRIHYAVVWGRKVWHRWCDPGHRNYERARELLPAKVDA